MGRTIEAYKLRTEIEVQNQKGSAALRATEKDVDNLGKSFEKLGPRIDKAMRGRELGARFGQSFSASATSVITGSLDSLGTTLGSIIGTAIAPGIGTAIGSTIGSGVDAAVSKVSGVVVPLIRQGIELNKQLELTRVEFTTFAGSEKEAVRYLDDLKKLAVDTGTDFRWVLETSEHLFDLTGNLKDANIILKAATEQAADFGGGAATIMKVADALGLVAEKGELSGRELQKLFKLGIDGNKYLAQATGLSVREIEKLIAQGRIRGEVAARLIAEGINRDKGGFAKKLTDTTVQGAENRFNVLTQLRSAEGTAAATQGIGDFYRTGNRALSSETAKDFVNFIDQTTSSIISLTKTGLETGIGVTKGLADGITSGDGLKAVGSAVTELGEYTTNTLKGWFKIQSPSQLTHEVIGVPIGEGIAQGIKDGFVRSFGTTQEQIVNELEKLLDNPRVQAFFDAIRLAEGGAPNIIVGGKRFSDLSRHPNVVGLRTSAGPSTAAGSFQITGSNWYGKKGRPGLQKQLGLPDFSAHSQELAALWLFAQRDGGAGLRALLGGDIPGAMGVAAKDWTSTPGSRIGGGRPIARTRWLQNYNKALAGTTGGTNGVVPVQVMNWNRPDLIGGAAQIFGVNPQPEQQQDLKDYTLVLSEADGAVVDITTSTHDLIDTTAKSTFEMRKLVNMSSIVPRAITPLIAVEELHAETAIDMTKKYQEAARKQLVVGVSLLTQISGAIGQISGFMPQQEVGKKRGFWSKVLGIAAPFLSFIPGVGPILSQVAGMASAGLGGNWAGVVSGAATGFASGGVFRRTASTPMPGGGVPSLPGEGLQPRARGGSGFRGRVYWTGEHGPEPFVAPDDGHFLSHRDAMRAMSSGGSDPGTTAVLERLHAVLARLESVRPHDVVRMGARGLIDAYDQDAGLIRLSGQRHRLA